MQSTESGMIPEGAEYFITKYGRTSFYKEEIVFNIRVLSCFDFKHGWTIGGHMPWDEIKPISEYKPA